MSSFRLSAEIESHWPACAPVATESASLDRRFGEDITGSLRRQALARTIEAEIIPRLVIAHADGYPARADEAAGKARVEPEDVEEFARLLLCHDASVALAFAALKCEQGAPLSIVFIELFTPAARYLGELWAADICDFSDVTIALSRLQQIVREMSWQADGHAVLPAPAAGRALLAAYPGEQHTFGICIVQELFRRAGWEVSGECVKTNNDMIDLARNSPFDVVGLSVSNDTPLSAVKGLIGSIRKSASNPAVRIMVGGRFFLEHPELVARVGADATAPDGRRAVPQLSSLLDTIAMRY
jgi:methanogenic corrinoid protein MtbC1